MKYITCTAKVTAGGVRSQRIVKRTSSPKLVTIAFPIALRENAENSTNLLSSTNTDQHMP